MQLMVAIALSAVYAGLVFTLGGADPTSGGPWWLFVPAILTFGAALVATFVPAAFPTPWATRHDYSRTPRRVHLPWRAALWVPMWMPVLFIARHFLWILWRNSDVVPIRLAFWFIVALITTGAVFIGFRRWHEIQLLRTGEAAIALVGSTETTEEWMNRIAYRFVTSDGSGVLGSAWDHGYRVREGSAVPAFYNPKNPKDHIIACACWFEAD
jgi:Protein of unknown function (DUF3592)